MRKIGSVPICLLLAACAVGDPNYPAKWDPLPPPRSADCRHFEGQYADQGDTDDRFEKASLTRELFGYRPGWKAATRVQFALPRENVLEVTVWTDSGELLRRTLHAADGEFACEAGRLVIYDKRWVAEELLATYENVTLELYANGRYLLAFVKERTYALAFVVVPFAADATHWFRFKRVKAAEAR